MLMSFCRRAFGCLSLMIGVSMLAACGGSTRNCDDLKDPYLTARSNEALKIPDGFSSPDRTAALTIPGSTVGKAGSGCLAVPPSYFRSSGTIARSPEEVVASWAQAWAARESDAVLELYSTTFAAPTDAAGPRDWLEQRREQVATGPVPDSMIEGLTVDNEGPDRRTATFVQKFGTNSLRKQLVLIRESGSWRIVEEKVLGVK
jgi:hypothetical protein